jgi:lipid-binding SYLF domain-containing protein
MNTQMHTIPGINEIKGKWKQRMKFFTLAIMAVFSTIAFNNALAASTAEELDQEADVALQALYKTNPLAAELSKKSRAILVFPKIVKAGFVFGAGYGEGVLMENAKAADYYNSVTGSWGLQAGAQSYGYVVFLMTGKSVKYLKDSHGWEIGVGPTVVVVTEGVAKNLSTSTLKDDAYAFIFDQQGLMLGVSIEGTKITHIKR